jgi:Tol biopolymer transport system component
VTKSGSTGSTAADVTIGAAAQITANEGLEIDAALSPDGKLLAYSAGHARQMRVFIRPVAGGRVLTLSEGDAAFEYQPRWSPDGSQILFLRPEGVFVASSLGGAARQVASGWFSSAAWLPDGARVLLARGLTLAVVPLSGGTEQAVAAGGDDLHSCAWSPVNEWIACASGNSQAVMPGRGFGNVAPSAIVLIPPTGGPFITVAERTLVNLSPAWSPDGRQLYFVSNRGGPRDVYAIDVDARGPRGEPRRVTTGMGVQSIAFSSAFNRLAYVTSVMRANIWSLPIPTGGSVDTSGATPVTDGTQVVEGINASSDSKWLVFDSTLHLNAEILRVPVGGGTVERLTRDPVDDFAPDLSPDGRMLAYHSWKTGSRDIFVQPLDGGPVQQLTNTPGQESYPRWSPDGKAITFVAQEQFVREVVHGTLSILRRQDNGNWSAPKAVANNIGTRGAWLRRGDAQILVHPREGSILLITPETGATETIYVPVDGSSDPLAWSITVGEDRVTLYFKSADAAGNTTLWSLPVTGGKPRLLVRFADPNRQSLRPDFAVAAGKFFFTIEDRQADIWVAEVGKK